MRFADRDGELAVRIAREAIDSHLLGRAKRALDIPRSFEEKSGAFVTLNTFPVGELRGCIGYPQPFFALVKSIEKAAEAAATEDPRFPPMRSEELDRVTVEVSILTPPRLIEVRKPKELPSRVTIGIDGLSVAQGAYRGLLLPQVAVEEGLDAADFLSQACMKAGLLADAWLDPETRVYTFQAEVFAEVQPRGSIVRRRLEAAHADH
ncbi:MAG: TIGR00296 family protein [Methanobacteriota archaeon]|nr:MAG: TIGR00296 family protein [Euryarchaeota archaeon]